MRTLRRFRPAAGAAMLALLVLGGCTSDPITASLRPTPEDRANRPKPAPTGSMAALLRLGDAIRTAGDPASAVAFYRRAHALDVYDPAPLVRLGTALNDLGAYSDAAEAFRQALVGDPASAAAMRGLGMSLIALDQPALAIDQFEAALQIKEDYRSYNGLGVAIDRTGDHKSAQAYYNVGLEMAPNNLTLLNNLGLSYALSGAYDAAIETLTKAVSNPNATARHRQNLALAYGLAGRPEAAARVARIDLGEAAVRNNVAYYDILREANEKGVNGADALGVHSGPARPGTAAGGFEAGALDPPPPAPRNAATH